MTVEVARNTQNFPNGSKVVTITTAILPNESEPPGPGNAPSNIVSASTINKGKNGELPPGYINGGAGEPWPGATVE